MKQNETSTVGVVNKNRSFGEDLSLDSSEISAVEPSQMVSNMYNTKVDRSYSSSEENERI